MKSSKTFNNISDKLRAQIPKLKPGQVVLFQMTNGTPNPEPDEKERSKDPMLYGKQQLLTQFRIFDQYQKDAAGNEVGGYVDCGCVDAWVGETPTKFRCYVTGQGQYSRFQGKFQLQGGVVADEELYEILFLSPQREGSPCADPSVETVFKIMDTQSEAKDSVNKFDRLKKAIGYLESITPEKARSIFASLNMPSYQDESVLLSKIKDFGRNNVETFLSTYEAPETDVKGKLKKAMELGILFNDIATGETRVGDQIVTTLKSKGPDMFLEIFSNWLNTAENGKDVLSNIEAQVAKKQAVKS
jgi:hypothetical protein